MDMIDLTKLRIYLDNKSATNIVDLKLEINEGTLPLAKVKLTQRTPTEGLFQSGVKEVVTECALENWRDQVLRLRTLKKDGSVTEDEETSDVFGAPEEEDANRQDAESSVEED